MSIPPTQPDSRVNLAPAEAEYLRRLQSALGNQYSLKGMLAQGGMGAVYIARDERLDRDVAVKTLRSDVFPSRVAIERFDREARALARLRHPNILPVYAVGEGEGLAFMITPRIEGTDLRAVMDADGRMDVSEAIRIASDVARALDAAHRLGIVHRDIKPDNILLEGADRHVLLADFGIAKSPDEESALTATGMIVGSPRYMSPEQMAGDMVVGPPSDVYALGTVLYEMIAGRPPFDGGSTQRLIMQKATTSAPSLSTVAPEIQTDLSVIVEQCLEREAENRPTAAALVRHLERVAASRGSENGAEPASWLEKRGVLIIAMFALIPFLAVSSTFIGLIGRSALQNFLTDFVLVPLIALLLAGFTGLAVEMTFVLRRVESRTGSSLASLRATFGQPRWWVAWYPRRLRASESTWEEMSVAIRVLRSVLFLEALAAIIGGPLRFVIVPAVPLARGAGVPLALPLRVMISIASAVAAPLLAGLAVLVLGITAVSITRRQSPLRTIGQLTAR